MLAHVTRLSSLLGTLALVIASGCGNSGSNQVDGGTNGDASPPDANLTGVTAVPLTSLSGLSYTAPLKFGAQTFGVIVDTGSSSTGVASSTCTTCGVTPAYDAGSTGVDKHATASSSYGDGSMWNGEVFEDHAAIGGGPNIVLDFASITSQNGFFRGNFQGIAGLGPSAALLPHTTSYIEAAIASGMTSQFAFQLCADSGTMWLGGYDSSKTTAAPSFTPMVSSVPFYYMVQVGGASIGGTSLGVGTSDFGPTVVDTGTSISFVPKAVINKLTAAVTATAGYKSAFGTQALTDGGCVTTSMSAAQVNAALPAFGLTVPGGSGEISIPATQSYLLEQGSGSFCLAFSDSSHLFGGQTVSLFGDSLLTGMVTIFDVGQKKIGFAPQTGCAIPAAARVAPHLAHTPGTPWFREDPRVRLPSRPL